MATPTLATTHVQALLADLEEVKAKGGVPTYAYFRLIMTAPIRQELEHFASRPEWQGVEKDDAHSEVLESFRKINSEMWKQETKIRPGVLKHQPDPNDFPIVIGGKYAAKPNSISETLVELLSESCAKVYTVSRSSVKDLPPNIVHMAKSNLEVANVGADEFIDVFNKALEDHKATPEKRLAVYFTLGKHTGENPFAKNVAAVDNLCLALKQCVTGSTLGNFRVILTGTDATNPSNHPDGTATIQGQELLIPSYKISNYNYVYAMSKIYQFYRIAHTLLGILSSKDASFVALAEKVNDKLIKMSAHIDAVGDNGMYDETASNALSMEELNAYSRDCQGVQDVLSPFLHVAKGISICYTPLHAIPWTNKALEGEEESPRAFVLEQVIRRLKNAISPKLAARYHFPIVHSPI